jgi:DNA-binding NarL/FixJ family response regulator
MDFDADAPVNVLLVDDNLLYRSSLELIVQRLLPDAHITHANGLQAALWTLARAPLPTLVLADLDALPAPHWHGLAELRAAQRELPIVALGDDDDPQSVRSAIDCGAMSYLTKADDPLTLSEALACVLEGGATIPPVALSVDHSPTAALCSAALGPIDHELLQATLRSGCYSSIGRNFSVGEPAVRAHARTLLHTLGLQGRTSLVYAVARAGLRFAPLCTAPCAKEPLPSYKRSEAVRSTMLSSSNCVGTHSRALNSTSYA